MPSRKHFTEYEIPRMYNQVKSTFQGRIKLVNYFSATTDLHCKNCRVYITQNFVWNFGQKNLHFLCVTITQFLGVCMTHDNLCPPNTPILFPVRLLYVIIPQLILS